MRDFRDEVPGYLNNSSLSEALEKLDLKSGVENLNDNLQICYEQMVRMELVGAQELDLLEAWISDMQQISSANESSVGAAAIS
jgi:hypothetical protein